MQSDKILVCRCITEPGAVATALNLAKDTDELTRRERYRNGWASLAGLAL
jgi:hypothetical protein